MVAWALREGQWTRWMSPVTTRANELQEHWLRSQQLLGNESGQLQLLDGVDVVEVDGGAAFVDADEPGDLAPFQVG